MATTTYNEDMITEAVRDYANHYGIEMADVEVSRAYEGYDIVGFRLSTRGVTGQDERFGNWN